ncbi:hypothetical protein MBANPS3_007558 [Mucor bainieri]
MTITYDQKVFLDVIKQHLLTGNISKGLILYWDDASTPFSFRDQCFVQKLMTELNILYNIDHYAEDDCTFIELNPKIEMDAARASVIKNWESVYCPREEQYTDEYSLALNKRGESSAQSKQACPTVDKEKELEKINLYHAKDGLMLTGHDLSVGTIIKRRAMMNVFDYESVSPTEIACVVKICQSVLMT